VVWNFISSVMKGGTLFTGPESYIIRLPYSLYEYRFVWSRIAIAIATCFEPEIIVMNEWIAGYEYSMSKAEVRIDSFVDKASVLVREMVQQGCVDGGRPDTARG